MKVRTVINNDDRFTCEFHAETCSHRKEDIVKQYVDEVQAGTIEQLCSVLQQGYIADAQAGWGDWNESEIKVSTEVGALFRVFPCVKF